MRKVKLQSQCILKQCEPLLAVDCGPLSDPPYGRVNTSAGTTFNKVAHYSCNNGYILVGSMTRTCAENGRWSPSSPRCDRKLWYSICTYSDMGGNRKTQQSCVGVDKIY